MHKLLSNIFILHKLVSVKVPFSLFVTAFFAYSLLSLKKFVFFRAKQSWRFFVTVAVSRFDLENI